LFTTSFSKNLFAIWHQRLWFKNNGVSGLSVGVGVERCKIVFLEALPIHLFGHFCCRMYRYSLTTMYKVTLAYSTRIIRVLYK